MFYLPNVKDQPRASRPVGCGDWLGVFWLFSAGFIMDALLLAIDVSPKWWSDENIESRHRQLRSNRI
jgi:hypothetical protein